MLKKISIIVFFVIFFGSGLNANLHVKIHATQALLYNPSNETVLFAKQENAPCHPASLIKIATALFVLEGKKLPLDFPCIATKEALSQVHASNKHLDPAKYPPYILEHDVQLLGLTIGETYSLEVLLHALLINSCGDAANVIAENCSGSIPQFIQELNHYLKTLGFSDTSVQNPHGLYYPTQLSTPVDLAKMMATAMKNKTFAEIIKKPNYSIVKKNKETYQISTTNKLIKKGPFYYPKTLGGKTGYFHKAGYNLVAAASHNDRVLIAVLVGCKERKNRFEDAIALFEAAFLEEKMTQVLFSQQDPSFTVFIEKQKIQASLEKDLVLSYYPAEKPSDLRAHITWSCSKLPIQKGECVGRLSVATPEGIIWAEAPLFANESVSQSFFEKHKFYLPIFIELLIPSLLIVFTCFFPRLRRYKEWQKNQSKKPKKAHVGDSLMKDSVS